MKFRGRGGVNWTQFHGFNASLFLNYVNPYKYNGTTVKSWTTFDLYAAYNTSGSGLLGGVTLGVNFQNLFDRNPPFINIPAYAFNPGGYDPQQANAFGRIISFTVTKKF